MICPHLQAIRPGSTTRGFIQAECCIRNQYVLSLLLCLILAANVCDLYVHLPIENDKQHPHRRASSAGFGPSSLPPPSSFQNSFLPSSSSAPASVPSYQRVRSTSATYSACPPTWDHQVPATRPLRFTQDKFPRTLILVQPFLPPPSYSTSQDPHLFR